MIGDDFCFHCESHCRGRCPQRVAADGHWLPKWIAVVVLVVLCVIVAVCNTGCGAQQQHALDQQQEVRLADLERDNAELERLLVLLAEAVARAEANIKRAMERLK